MLSIPVLVGLAVLVSLGLRTMWKAVVALAEAGAVR